MPGTDLKKKINKKNCFALLKNHPFPPTPLKFPSLSNLLSLYYPKIKKNKKIAPLFSKITLFPPLP